MNIFFDVDSHTDSVTLAHFFRTGRVYLSKSSALLKLLTTCLKEEEKDSPSRQNVLVAVQKLSLRYISSEIECIFRLAARRYWTVRPVAHIAAQVIVCLVGKQQNSEQLPPLP